MHTVRAIAISQTGEGNTGIQGGQRQTTLLTGASVRGAVRWVYRESLVRGHRDALRSVHRCDSDFDRFLLYILAEECILHAFSRRLDGAHRPRGSRTIVATGRPTGTSTLGTRPRRISAAVLPVGNTEISVIRLVLHSVNSFDGVGDVCEVDESAVPTSQSGCRPKPTVCSTDFSLRKLTSSMSPYSPKSLFSFSSLKASKSSMLPT